MRLFVYGSLLPGFETHARIRPYLSGEPLPGRVRGRLVDVGAYPALVVPAAGEAEATCVRGLWYGIGREGLAAADAYEEYFGIEETNDYERFRLRDADDPGVEGWVYVWTETRGYPFAAVDWWPDTKMTQLEKPPADSL